MHVLFLTYHLPLGDEPGAFRPWMEARLLELAGLEVTVVTSGVHYMTGKKIKPDQGWCTEEVVDGVRILRTWGPTDHRRSLFRRLLSYVSYTVLAAVVSLVKVGRVQRVFAGTDPFVLVPAAYLISVMKQAPMVLDERDLYPDAMVTLGVMKEGLLTRLLLAMQQHFRRKARGILAATPGIRQRLIDYGFPDHKVHLLCNADVFLHEDSGQDAGTGTLRESTGRSFLVGYTGGLGASNDIPTLLRASERLLDCNDVAFVIVGGGENRTAYEEYCRSRSLNNVFFVPAVPRREARKFIKEMDVCVHLYPPDDLFAWALASKMLDYLGLGKPVVFGGKGDTAELLEASGGGIVVDSGDDKSFAQAVRLLRSDERLRMKMSASARHWFEENVRVDRACSLMRRAVDPDESAALVVSEGILK